MPPNHQIVLFPRGITTLACITGKEHKNMCQILLGLIVNLQITGGSSSAWVLKAVHSVKVQGLKGVTCTSCSQGVV